MPANSKVALVTGSTSGIGLAIARKFAEEGYAVALNSFEPESGVASVVEEVKTVARGDVGYFSADLSKGAAGYDLVKSVIAGFGRIDILVNNAGVQKVAAIEDFPPGDWERIRAISLDGSFHTIRAALPDMYARSWGRIINIASAHGLRASPYKSAYVATKHGVIGLTKTVALEAAEKGVTVNAICPGYVWTPLAAKQIEDQTKVHHMSREEIIRNVMLAPQPTKEFVQPEEIASLAHYLAGDMARSITGTSISIDGGWTAK
jgi:3-hydroxybutyrate dehydrogenase